MISEPKVAIVGAGSQIGAALARRLGRDCVAMSRSPQGHEGERIVARYEDLGSTDFVNVDRVVNCIGQSSGPPELLRHVNVSLPREIARHAREAGVAHFVHISSFSVYGDALLVDGSTPENPTSDYGRSKRDADDALNELSNDAFAVTCLRLPLVYSFAKPGKLGSLLRLWKKTRILPIPANDIERAMISADLSAETILGLLARPPRRGTVHAADAEPFAYRKAARASSGLRTVAIPEALRVPLLSITGATGKRMFGDSRLRETDNLAHEFGIPSQLYADIARLQSEAT
ncbi:NAD-dependent epimerase/dehydratase family protein [Alteriqipengyuania lutimaris]|uniref:NAD-dependent epimerase/dehydratase family protein n=1 Tax=Alteriqipengyuania lutimaris TaxID=1538146 RepID=UPI0015F13B70|nr:NAD-dependent epimerase/dehydratase family protein [Alteriqipengyuania lutimaris]MBB3034375.1 UDP-glucose 4-epimerase [Alteriqipengyuania lutimaris]